MNLLEREASLRTLHAAFNAVAAGNGCAVLIGGEAGIGKTSLVERFTQDLHHTAHVLWGACDDLFTPRPLGPLHDIAPHMSGDFARLLAVETNRAALFAAFLADVQRPARPAVIVFEDVHWADEATLDLIKFIGRRIHRLRALLVITYRDDELDARHPLRGLLGDLATSPAMQRLTLEPLSIEAVRTLAQDQMVEPSALHRQTGGNPFFVTEVLANNTSGIPATVRDAVLARTVRLSASGQAVLEAAAAIGTRVEPWLLADVMGAEAEAVGEGMAIGMLLAQGKMLLFRHELARQTILTAIVPTHLRALHRLILDALKASPVTQHDYARLAHHAGAADDHAAVLEYAPLAARQAAAATAHREAIAQYALALRHAGDGPPADRAQLLESYAVECGHTDPLEAIAARRQALELWRASGNRLKEGEVLAQTVHSLVGMGRNAEAEDASRAAIDLLEALPPGPQLALAYRMHAHLRMLKRDFAEAIRWGEKSIELAENFQEFSVLAMAYNTVGSALMFSDYDRGCAYLEQSLYIAREHDLDFWVANAYANLGAGCGELYQFQHADEFLADGTAFCAERDLDVLYWYMVAWQALSHMQQGHWAAAREAATQVVHQPTAMTISRITALLTLGRLYARQGDEAASDVLDEALALAQQTDTVQRLAPIHAARAEAAWLNGDVAHTLIEARAVYDLALSKRQAWFVGELALWRWRAGEQIDVPAWTSEPFALQIAGEWRNAARAWARLNCPYEQARALADGDEAAQREALILLDRLGARPAAKVVKHQLRAHGVRGIPRGPRPLTRETPFGLTVREREVLTLLADGLSNPDIAARLSISAKTAGHHVSAILAKLKAHTRSEAAVIARRQHLI